MHLEEKGKEELWNIMAETIGKRIGAYASMIVTDITTRMLGFQNAEDMGIDDNDIEQLHKMITEFVEKNIYKRKSKQYSKLVKEKIVENKEYIIRLLIVKMLVNYISKYYSDHDLRLLYTLQGYMDDSIIGIVIKRGSESIAVKVIDIERIEEHNDTKTSITGDVMFR